MCKWWMLEMETSHHTIMIHDLIVLTKVYLVSYNRRNLIIEFSFIKTLQKVASFITEEVRFYHENVLYICFYYIHRF